MAIAITPEQRDALHDQIVDHLCAVDDLRMAIERGDFETAKRLAGEFADEIGLLNEDLGWGEGPAETIELTSRPDLLRRVFFRLGPTAERLARVDVEREREMQKLRPRNEIVAELCRKGLAELDA